MVYASFLFGVFPWPKTLDFEGCSSKRTCRSCDTECVWYRMRNCLYVVWSSKPLCFCLFHSYAISMWTEYNSMQHRKLWLQPDKQHALLCLSNWNRWWHLPRRWYLIDFLSICGSIFMQFLVLLQLYFFTLLSDIDECSTGQHNCDVPDRATCDNTRGSFLCHCRHGFCGEDGRVCKGTCSSTLPLANEQKKNPKVFDRNQVHQTDQVLISFLFSNFSQTSTSVKMVLTVVMTTPPVQTSLETTVARVWSGSWEMEGSAKVWFD